MSKQPKRERLASTIDYCSAAEFERLWLEMNDNESILAAAA